MWKTAIPKPARTASVLNFRPLQLSVTSRTKDRWQYFSMSFGSFSTAEHDECLKTWPHEALRLAREELDRFEAQLKEG